MCICVVHHGWCIQPPGGCKKVTLSGMFHAVYTCVLCLAYRMLYFYWLGVGRGIKLLHLQYCGCDSLHRSNISRPPPIIL